jgi:hypothetical protein
VSERPAPPACDPVFAPGIERCDRLTGIPRTPRARGSLLALLLAAATAAGAEEIAVPVRLDTAFVRAALVSQLFTGPGETAPVWRDERGCGWLTVAAPAVDVVEGRLRVLSRGEARLATPVAGRCLGGFTWRGQIEVFEEPELDPAARAVTFRVVDSNLYDEGGRKRLATGVLWDLVKAHVHPRLARVRIDLTRPFEELRAWLPLVLPGTQARVDRLLASLAVRDARVVEDGVAVAFVFAVEPAAPPPAPAPEPALGPEELARWEERLERWDGFLTFVVKRVARGVPEAARVAALDVLIDARHALLEALAPSAPDAPDPVPALFLAAWAGLAPVLREAAPGLPAETALQYLGFIAAGDALAALGRLGPESGLEISADGLRRLARMLDPAAIEDPVAYGLEVDPELRGLLGLGPPLPAPEIDPEVQLDLLSRLVPRAWAAVDPSVARLNRWSPTRADLDEYLPLVGALLERVHERTLDSADLGADFHRLFRHLVLATAWQESCWRQFVRKGGRLVPLQSPVGSVGLMQVNVRVWRGVYDVKGLHGDMAYNGRAGAEIALHYLRDYAIARGEHRRPGGLDNLARATYAAYNGGPGHLTRYRAASPRRALKAIDDAFWEKYVAVRAGREMDVARCYGV